MRITQIWNESELKALNTPIIVEQWGKQKYGRVKRAWLKEFNHIERAKAYRLYKDFYRWYLVKGLPREKQYSIKTVEFIKRLVDFFARI